MGLKGLTLFCLIWVTDEQCLYLIIPENWAPQGKGIINWRLKFGFNFLTLYSHLFFGGWSLTFIRSSPSLMRWPKFTSWISWREKNASETNTQRLKWSKLLLDLVISETHKGLKCVTLICLLCPMLIRIHFQKYHIWNEKKRSTWPIQLDSYKGVT